MKDLVNKITQASNLIDKQNRMGVADYIIGGERFINTFNDYNKRTERKTKIKKLISNINEKSKN